MGAVGLPEAEWDGDDPAGAEPGLGAPGGWEGWEILTGCIGRNFYISLSSGLKKQQGMSRLNPS